MEKAPKVYEEICRLASGEVFLVSVIVLFHPMSCLQKNDAKFRSSLDEFNPSIKKKIAGNPKINDKINYVI